MHGRRPSRPAGLDRRPAADRGPGRGLPCRLPARTGHAADRDLYPARPIQTPATARVIPDAARTMPHTLRALDLADETAAQLTMLVGFDQDLAGGPPAPATGCRGLLPGSPSLERVLGPRLDHEAVTLLLDRFGFPQALRKAGRRQLVNLLRPKGPCMAGRLVDDISDAFDEQAVVTPRHQHARRDRAVAGAVAGRCPRATPGPGSQDRRTAGPPPVSPLMPALPRRRSPPGPPCAANTHHGPETGSPNGPCSSPLSPPCTTAPRAPATADAGRRHLLRAPPARDSRRMAGSGLTKDMEAAPR